ncbi:hypothetical protein IGS59_27615 [Janthinobacterium sp. GW460P]|uniref:hypothetical protein n=1 Tax=unclassified Janthinobacterium TaxID=2610881 RepID=UPI00111C4A9B|nr:MULTISPECIES: hypothetical protein [unclassified Janthinobacterium]MCC7706017.1 hypothetical protein [Janthinobacterium sp. GW460P]MCC7711519.1 hypothetical protein [Janthinobacterium sp. GW460W]
MLDVKRRIEVISGLLEQRTPESATYAALECRLAIEYLCYERMQLALELASYADMGGWTPSKVVRAVEELVDEHIASSFTLLIASEPNPVPGQELTLEEFEKLDYHPLGTQAPLDLKKLTKLWNALANSALHVQVPKLRTDQLSIHGDISRTTEKVQQCLTELRKIADGTLLSNGFGPEVSVVCDGCGHPVKRRVKRLSDKQTVSCVNPNCAESYTVEKVGDDEFTFERRLALFECKDCGVSNNLPLRQVEKMRVVEAIDIACSRCSALYKLSAQLQITKV